MGVKMGWIQMGHPLARNGAALAPFRANGAHPSIYIYIFYGHHHPRLITLPLAAHARAG